MGADQKETTGHAEQELPALGIEDENMSAPGTSAQGCEQGWLTMYARVALQTRQNIWLEIALTKIQINISAKKFKLGMGRSLF
ncbi:hypothetical protein DPMN_141879 [Dreissena polymorpha]|uniref:Uncharacterized protein n=1 Tax=Dreissena polymorpha TaxID=45954 RepID=A0A9D4GG71_DREPO|nr:hypothetical protein DPMN_141879 [Dreissena polymorpha]